VDIVETGSTLKAHNLVIKETLCDIKVNLIANPAYYKLRYREVNELVRILETEGTR
jgi:ATP phosphoribosyltransferase